MSCGINKVSATARARQAGGAGLVLRYLSEVPRAEGKILNKISLQGIKTTKEKGGLLTHPDLRSAI